MRRFIKTITGLALLSFTLLAAVSCQAEDTDQEFVAKVRKELAEEKAILVDVREIDETGEGFIKDALLLPLSDVQLAAAKSGQRENLLSGVSKKKILYCYCRSGGRAEVVAAMLKPWGYDARPMKPGGFRDLVEAGFEATVPERAP